MLQSIVIVGAGQAGFQAAHSLRQEGYAGRIVLVGAEPGLPYQRPPLSKAYLLGKATRESLFFRPAKFYDDQKIELVHDEAVAIDRTNRRVMLRQGGAVAYDHLVLATGAHNRALPVPGAELAGVHGLRSLADADAIGARLKGARHVVVVGAGFIGLEFAAVAATGGASVHVLELADRPMARAVSREMSAFFADQHRTWGSTLDCGQGLALIEGTAAGVTGVVTTEGRRLAADLVVFGIGVLPNVALAAEAGLDIDNGIRVDRHLLTSDPAISAVGDCAAFPAPDGEWIRLESVQNAVDQAKVAAARLAGRAAPYDAVPWFWTDQGDLKLQMAGLSPGHDETVVLGRPAERSFSVLLFRRGHLVAVEAVNKAGDYMAARKLLARQPALSPAEAAAPGFELRAYEAATR